MLVAGSSRLQQAVLPGASLTRRASCRQYKDFGRWALVGILRQLSGHRKAGTEGETLRLVKTEG